MIAAIGTMAMATMVLTVGAAQAEPDAPTAVTANITGGDHLVHPNLWVNDYSFPNHITVAQGGTVTFVNKTDDPHLIAMVSGSQVPTDADQVDNCPVCNDYIGAFGLGGNGPPAAVQVDEGQPNNTEGAPDTGAIATITNPALTALPWLIEDFDTASTASSLGDATLIDTSNPINGEGGATQRTVVVTAAPGVYHYICAFHPWMQGTIRVIGGGGDDS